MKINSPSPATVPDPRTGGLQPEPVPNGINSCPSPAVNGEGKEAPLTDLDAPKSGPFGLSPSDEAALTRYGVRLNAVDGLNDQAKAAGLTPDEVKALGNYLFDFGAKQSAEPRHP